MKQTVVYVNQAHKENSIQHIASNGLMEDSNSYIHRHTLSWHYLQNNIVQNEESDPDMSMAHIIWRYIQQNKQTRSTQPTSFFISDVMKVIILYKVFGIGTVFLL